MRQHWRGRPLYRPSRALWQILHAHLIGGRVDTLQPHKRHRWAFGEDMSSAYPWAAQQLPGGTAERYEGEPSTRYATYYQKATLLLPDYGQIALGPLPTQDWTYRTSYPTWGPVTGWYWKEELDDALAAGSVYLERSEGYGWPYLRDALQPWSQCLYGLRQAATTPDVAGIIKTASVAALGRMAMGWTTRTLVPSTEANETLERWSGDGKYAIKEETRASENMLIQGASYVHMQVRRALYQRAKGYAERQSLISTNYDEILYTGSSLSDDGVGGGR